MKRGFYIRDAMGSQSGPSLAIVNGSVDMARKLESLDCGEYTIRDCLGGLRMRIRIYKPESECVCCNAARKVQILESTK